MEQNIFSPRIQKVNTDSISSFLKSTAQGILIVLFGFLPIFFVPGIYTSLGFTKVYFVALGVFAALVLLSLAILRSGSARVVIPPALAFFWLFTLTALASALLSGDSQDALYGNVIEVHTAGFLVLMALVMTVALSFSSSKSGVTRLFTAIGVGAIVLQLFHVLRLFLGPEFLSFGIFTSPTVSLIGSFNDLAIFSGLVILVSLMVMQQMSARLAGKTLSLLLVVSSLVILAVVNFYTVWLTVGFLALLMCLYLISKDTWLKTTETDSLPVSRFTLSVVGLVCIVSAGFIVSGDFLGGAVSRMTDISYLEIRPSVTATLDITKAALAENALLGVGPNRFEDAWREYKNPVINQTAFWNTNFSAGNGYVPTLVVTTGLAGGVFLLLFLGAFVYLGYRTLFVSKIVDQGWYLVGSVAFLSAFYLWVMALVYVPGVSILLLCALMTGVAFAVYVTVKENTGVIIDVTASRQYGLLLIAAVLVIIISSTLTVIGLSKQFVSGVVYADTVRAFQTGSDLVSVDTGLTRASELNSQDLFLSERAQIRLAELNNLSAVEPESFDQQRFAAVLAEGIALAEQAIALDGTNPNNYILLTNFYGLLDPTQFEGVRERNEALFARARELDATNPYYFILMAQYKARIGDLDAARTHLEEAIQLKSNYTDALFLLSQLDIQEGNTEAAIAGTRSIISLEPNNPTRYFQLGVLLATTNNLTGAVEAFEYAVALDNTYANARYFLALTYLDMEREEDALTQLRIVQQTNQDNEIVRSLIEQVESGTYVRPEEGMEVPIENEGGVTQNEDVTTTTERPDTDLVTPLNQTGPETEDEQPETTSETPQ